MEKTVRVCDGCGHEFGENEPSWRCSVCGTGRDFCEDCTQPAGIKGAYYLCPTHYKQEKEHIEQTRQEFIGGLKEGRFLPIEEWAKDINLDELPHAVWVSNKKFVPEVEIVPNVRVGDTLHGLEGGDLIVGKDEIMYGDRKFVPEEPKGIKVESTVTGYRMESEDATWLVHDAEANALCDHIRRERDGQD